MPETRRMHYVPRTYLKHFARKESKGDGFEYFIHTLSQETGLIKEINIKHICLETDMYKVESENPETRQLVETIYSKVFEDTYDELYNLLIDERQYKITDQQRYTVIQFVVSMYYRNNAWLIGHNKMWDETMEKIYYLAKANGKNSYILEDEEISIAGKSLEDIKRESRIENRSLNALTGIQAIFKLSRARLVNDVICVTKINSPFEFLISDNPVNAKGEQPGHVIPIDPANTFSIPINGQFLLQLRPWAHEIDQNLIGRLDETRMMAGVQSSINNAYQAAQSNRFLLGSKHALEEYLKKPMGILPTQQ